MTGLSCILIHNALSDSTIFINSIEYYENNKIDIPASVYDITLLYNSGRYVRYDSLMLRQNRYIEIDMSNMPLHESDSISRDWHIKHTKAFNYSYKDYEQALRFYKNDRGIISATQYNMFSNYVSGIVRDGTDGSPLPGASVFVRSINNGTSTDIDGQFKLDIEISPI